MNKYRVYSKDGEVRCTLTKVEYSGTFMGDRVVTSSFTSGIEIDFDVFDYVEFRGEKFELEMIPTVKKVSSYQYEYDLRFVSLKYELERCMFRNLVPDDNGVVYPTTLNIEFTGTVYYLVERIQACLDEMYGENVWSLRIEQATTSAVRNISISNQTCWNALSLINTEYDLYFHIRDRVITISDSDVIGTTFEYGKGNGLYEIERVVDTDTAVITKLIAYGGTRNLDYSYPKYPEWSDSVLPNSFILSPLRLMLPSFKKDGKTDYILATEAIGEYGIREGVMVYDDIYPSITGMTNSKGERIDKIRSVEPIEDEPDAEDTEDEPNVEPIEDEQDVENTEDNSGVEDTKNDSDVYSFVVYLNELGFDLNDCLTTDTPLLSMKTGALQGYSFGIKSIDVQEDGTVKLTLERNTISNGDTGNYYIPNKDFNMSAGDEFVFLGILMPQEYIRDAENRLEQRAREYLSQYNSTNYTYNIGIDEIFMAKNPTIMAEILEGKQMRINDAGMGIYGAFVTIQSLTIEDGDGLIPRLKVTLNNKPSASTLERIQGQINSIETSTYNQFSAQTELAKQYQRKLNTSYFHRFFVGIDKNGKEIAPNNLSTEIVSIKARYGLWTEHFLSAKGKNDGGSGDVPTGGATTLGGLRNVAVDADSTYDVAKMLVLEADSNLWTLKNLSELVGGLDEAELAAYLTNNNYAKKGDIPSLDGYATEQWVLTQIGSNTNFADDFAVEMAKWFAIDEVTGGVYPVDNRGFFTNSWLSANGANSSGGNSSGGAVALYQLNDVLADGTGVSGAQNGAVFVYDATIGKWKGVAQSEIVPNLTGYAKESWVLSQGFLTQHQDLSDYAKKSDIPSLSGYATEQWVLGKGYATTSDLDNRIDALVNGAPAAYDTLKEIADVLAGNVNSISDILTALGNKADKATTLSGYGITDAYTKSQVDSALGGYLPLSGGTIDGNLSIGKTDNTAYKYIRLHRNNKVLEITTSDGYGVLNFSGVTITFNSNGAYWNGNTLIHSGNIGSQSVAYASNAGMLEGHKLSENGNGVSWGRIAFVGADGVMDIGKYIDFRNDTTSHDFSTRLLCTGNYANYVSLPSTSGTLALLTDNVASADKLSDNGSYTAWGQTFFTNGKPKSLNGSIIGGNFLIEDRANNPYIRLNQGAVYIGYLQILEDGGVAVGSTSTKSLIVSQDGDVYIHKLHIGNGTIEWDETNKGFKIVGGLYTESYLSAKGANTNGSSSGGGLIESLWKIGDLGKTFNTDANDTFNAYAINAIHNRVSVLEGKATNVGFTQSLTSGTQIGTITIDGASKNIYAPTIPTNLSQFTDDVVSGKYLSLSGGTLTGLLTIDNPSNASYIQHKVKGAVKAELGYHIYYGVFIKNETSNKFLYVTDSGNALFDGKTIYHSGNTSTIKSDLGLGSFAYKSSLAFADLTNKPTTISGYGITDAYTKSQVDSALGGYLPLSGGTIDGNLSIGKTDNTAYKYIRLHRNNKVLEITTSDGYGVLNFSGVTITFNSNGAYWNGNTLIHSGNIGSQSVDNANKLGGYDSSMYVKSWIDNTDDYLSFRNKAVFKTSYISGQGDFGTLIIPTWTGNRTDNYYLSELRFDIGQAPKLRCSHNGVVELGWKTIAFTDSNVASATKLQTARAIWGQSFDGTGDVDGNITLTTGNQLNYTGTSTVHLGLALNYASSYSDGQPIRFFNGKSTPTEIVRFLADGNVGIGTTNPQYKLDVNGVIHSNTDIYSDGYVSATSLMGQNICIECDDTGSYGGGTYSSEINTFGSTLYLQYHSEHDLSLCSGGGYVGIGTDNPQYKLDVNGTLHASDAVSFGSSLSVSGATSLSSSLLVSGVTSLSSSLSVGSTISMSGALSGCTRISNANSGDLYIGNSNNSGWVKVQDMCSDNGSHYWTITNLGEGFFNKLNVGYTYSSGGSYDFNVMGVIFADEGIFSDGYVSAKGQNTSSDMRLKNVLNEVVLSVSDIANAPSMRFSWKNGGGVDVGSSAQYWQGLLPDAVKERDGMLEMQYANIALLSAIALAKNFETHEERIARLERENEELRNEINSLRYGA